MNAPKLLLSLLVMVVLFAIGTLWMLVTPEQQASAAAGTPSDAAAPATVEAGAELATPANNGAGTSALASATDSSSGSAAGQRAVAVTGREVEVLVRTPLTAPADPTLTVVAVPATTLVGRSTDELLVGLRTGELPASGAARAEVVDGRALLRLPEGMSEPHVLVDGRYLFVRDAIAVPETGNLIVAPRLGAYLRVRLDTPGEVVPESGTVQLLGGDFGGGGRNWSRRSRSADGTRELEFRAVDADATWMLTFDVERLHAFSELGIELEPGVARDLEITLTRGVTITGLVVDEAGQPLEGIEVRADGGGMWFGGSARSVETGADGTFELLAVGPGELVVETDAEGWVNAETEQFELADGERRDGVRLELSRGLAIAGRVLLPNGSPAAEAEVTLGKAGGGGGWGNWGGSRERRVGETQTDATGAFRISGLTEGQHTLRATLQPEGQRATWRATEDAIEAGRSDVLLTLAEPIAITGRVLDDLGAPVTQYEVNASSAAPGGPRVGQSNHDDEGAFVFELVGPGQWNLSIEAPGHVRSEEQLVRLPGEGQELEFVIARHASVAGRVVDSTGNAVRGATVKADDGSRAGNPWAGARGETTETDDEGAFVLAGLTPGGVSLTASAEEWADSEALALELAPGEEREGANLALRIGGRIEGMVVTPEGDPMVGQRVSWGPNAMGFGSLDDTTTDGSGRFVFEHVTPGDWAVSASPSMADMGRSMRGRRDQTAFVEVMGDLITQTVSVVDGEVSEVYLGGEPKRPVRVFGVLTRAGEAVAGGQVFSVSEDSAVFQGMKTATTAEDGSYELIVDRPGSYVVSANVGSTGVEALVDVPREDELRLDLAIPLGRIEGIVREPNASPAQGVRLSLQREDGLGRMRWAGGSAQTDAAGRYAFEDLEAGRYTVRANVSAWGQAGDKSWGGAVRSGVDVRRDAATTGVDFRLETSGSIAGIVRGPDGSPAAGVTLFFRDEAGRMVSTVSGTVTDAVGRFEETGLAPGAYSVSARGEALAAGDAASVAVRSEETAEVELEVELGTLLIVTLEDADGSPQRARVEVFDSDDREVGGMLTMGAMQATFNQGVSSREQRVGPLPPGRYTVRATAPDGRSDDKRLSLRGRETEKAVRLKLPQE